MITWAPGERLTVGIRRRGARRKAHPVRNRRRGVRRGFKCSSTICSGHRNTAGGRIYDSRGYLEISFSPG